MELRKRIWLIAKKLKEKSSYTLLTACPVCHHLESNHKTSGAFCFKSKSYTLNKAWCARQAQCLLKLQLSSACLEGRCKTFVRDTCQCFPENKVPSIFIHKTVTIKLSQKCNFHWHDALMDEVRCDITDVLSTMQTVPVLRA